MDPGSGFAHVAATGRTQAGIARPGTPQGHGVLLIADVEVDVNPGVWLPRLGEEIVALTAEGGDFGFLPDGAADLTITVGIGPRLVSRADPEGPGAADLPLFAGDEFIPPERRGGDLLLAAYASDASVLNPVLDHLSSMVPGLRARWRQHGFRGPGEGTIVRNPLGFHDGIIVPHDEEELEENVWISGGAFDGATICVIRRLRLDGRAFLAHPVEEQEAIIGRVKATGAPLSGGEPTAPIDLLAKTPQGEFVEPLRSHARAAHPSFTGSRLMLRRGYAYDDGAVAGEDDSGLLFICFQKDLRTFVATQQRLDETDDLMRYVTPTASGTFLILPGFDADRPLGSGLFSV